MQINDIMTVLTATEICMKHHIQVKLWGFVLILFGIGLAGQVFGVWSLHIFRGWWTLFIIVPSVIGMIEKGVNARNTTGLVVGGILLLMTQDLLGWDLIGKMVFPVILVAAGVSMLVQYSTEQSGKKKEYGSFAPTEEEYAAAGVHHSVFFSERTVVYPQKEYEGASLSVSFGKITFDLTHASFCMDRELYVNATFGTVVLLIPSGVNVTVATSPMFGSVRNDSGYQEGAPMIRVDASCIFANINILRI